MEVSDIMFNSMREMNNEIPSKVHNAHTSIDLGASMPLDMGASMRIYMETSVLYSNKFLTEKSNNANIFLKSIAYDVNMKGKDCAKKLVI